MKTERLSLVQIAERDHPQRVAFARAIVRLEAQTPLPRPRRQR